MSDDNAAGYQHYFKAVAPDKSYPQAYKRTLITTVDQLMNVLNQNSQSKYVAFDIETSDLNPEVGYIVGFSFAFSHKEAWYVPIKHMAGSNLPEEALTLLFNFMIGKHILVYNLKMELRWLRKKGYDIDKLKVFDVWMLVFVADTNWKLNGLKWAALHFLGWAMRSYDELTGGSALQELSPEQTYEYGCDDSLATYALFAVLGPMLLGDPRVKFIVGVDNMLARAFVDLEEVKIPVDTVHLEKLFNEMEKEILEKDSELFQMAGTPFNIGSPRQLSEVLIAQGIDTGERTKAGDLVTNAKHLAKFEGRWPFLDKLMERRKLFTLWNNYVKKMKEMKELRINYKQCVAPTARLATGSDDKNSFFSNVNIQSLVKPKPSMYWAIPSDGSRDDSILGWDFVELSKDEMKLLKDNKPMVPPREGGYIVEGFSPKLNLRNAILPRKDHYFISIDYSAQEVFLPAFLSNEPIWCNAFLTGKDVHRNTAEGVWGPENYNKDYRRKAKILNFGTLYGGTKYTVANAMRCGEDEGERVLNEFWSKMVVLDRWRKSIIKEAYQKGVLYTRLGRPRRVAYYMSHTTRRMRMFGERTAVNTQVQGLAGDILRIVIVNLWKKYFRVMPPEEIEWRATVHDEICFSVRKDLYETLVPQIIKVMMFTVPGFPMPLNVGVEVGNSWGSTFAFKEKDGKWLPKAA